MIIDVMKYFIQSLCGEEGKQSARTFLSLLRFIQLLASNYTCWDFTFDLKVQRKLTLVINQFTIVVSESFENCFIF
jgi:hypothetical protein